ncbi:MAG: DUF4411 family protein, partial [Bacteroidota bacterium]
AISQFLSIDVADAWLISYSLLHRTCIITHEKSQPERKKSIKIPDVCDEFQIRYIQTIEMFRELNEKF